MGIEKVSEEDATGQVAQVYKAAQKRVGHVAEIVQAMSLNGNVLARSMGFYQAVMFGESPLSRKVRELLATFVSTLNRCTYWQQQHSAAFRAEGGTEEEWRAIVEGEWQEYPWDSQIKKMLEFAQKLTITPQEVSPQDIANLRSVGLSDRAIHDAAQVIAYFNYINRIAEGLGVGKPSFLET